MRPVLHILMCLSKWHACAFDVPPQMLLDEFMSVRQMQLGHLWNKAAAWRAFKDLVDQGLIAFLAAR